MGRGETVASAIERSGLGAVLARVPAWRGVLVLGYHRIGAPVPSAHDTALWSATQDEFDRQLSFLNGVLMSCRGTTCPRHWRPGEAVMSR